MTFEEFIATRQNATPEDVEALRGLYNVLKGEITPDLSDFAKRADITEIKDTIKALEDKLDERASKAEPKDEFKTAMRGMFDKIKEGDRRGKELEDLSIRAAAVMTYGTAYSQAPDKTAIEIDKRIHSAPQGTLGVVSRLNKGASRTAVTRYTSLAGVEGNAEVTPEGGLKPLFSVNYNHAEATTKKIAVRVKVSEEFEDFTEFYDDLMLRAKRALTQKIEDEVVNGAGGANHLNGITNTGVAPAYNVPALAGSVDTPNIVDVILAMATQIRSFHFAPNVVFINPLDWSKLQFEKDADGRPMASENIARLGDIQVVKTDVIAQGKLLVMDDYYWNLYVNEVRVREGYGVQKVGDVYYSDLDVNMRTIIFETYVKSYCPAVELNSICYDTIANVQTAIASE